MTEFFLAMAMGHMKRERMKRIGERAPDTQRVKTDAEIAHEKDIKDLIDETVRLMNEPWLQLANEIRAMK